MGERKRRLSSAWGLKQAQSNEDAVGDVVEVLEPNDDEMEKRSRVTIDASSSPLRTKNPNKLAELASSSKDPKRRKSVGWGVIQDKENFPSSTPLSTAHLSNDQLADLYSSCIKLSTENVCYCCYTSFFIIIISFAFSYTHQIYYSSKNII